MRLLTTRQLLVCLALAGTFGQLHAAETRHTAPESAPAADPAPVSQPDRLEEADIDGAVAAAHAQRTQKAKSPTPAPAARTTSDSRAMPPRFHSFLPGMFR